MENSVEYLEPFSSHTVIVFSEEMNKPLFYVLYFRFLQSSPHRLFPNLSILQTHFLLENYAQEFNMVGDESLYEEKMWRMRMGKVAVPQITNPQDPVECFRAFVELVKILRRECPWDRKQTHKSLAYLLIEEVYETIEAIQEGNDQELSKELGDVLLHVIMHAVIAEERGVFTLAEVMRKEFEKLVVRHPHVFGDIQVQDADEVKKNWEQLKMQERGRRSLLEGVPQQLPSLLRAQRIQEKVSRVGFDWQNVHEAFAKVEEELAELKEYIEQQQREKAGKELGDLFFALVNIARLLGFVAEELLQETNSRFIRRFQYIERKAAEQQTPLDQMSLHQMDQLWEEAKAMEVSDEEES